MRLGVVVVTHGQLAAELMNSAEMIVGELPHMAAVSIGWHEDVDHAREDIGRAIERVQASAGGTESEPADVLVLTDLFGGTPANLGSDVRRPARGSDHRRQPADADQARAAAEGVGPPRARARDAGTRPERHLGDIGLAPRREGMTTSTLTVTNALGMHARAAARFVHTASAFASHIRVACGSGKWTGRASWACCSWARRRGA